MSHDATNWAIKQRGLKPATKIVLWHLADCHNGHTGQCNPYQDTLAEMCEMSRSTLNLHLSKLEEAGLIRRHAEIDPRTKRQRATRYTLALDDADLQRANDADEPRGGGQKAASENRTRAQDVVPPVSENETRAVSEKQPEPCPKNGPSRVRKSDTMNLGIEPGKNLGGGGADESASQDLDLGDEELWTELLHLSGHRSGRIPTYWSPVTAKMHIRRWRTDLGLTGHQILEAARQEQARNPDRPPPDGPKAFDKAMQRLAAALAAEPLTPISQPKGKRHDQHFHRAIHQLADRLSDGTAQLDTASRDPFARR